MTRRYVVTLGALGCLVISGASLAVAGGSGPALHSPHPPSVSRPVTSTALGCPGGQGRAARSALLAVGPGPASGGGHGGTGVTRVGALREPTRVVATGSRAGAPVVVSTPPTGASSPSHGLLVTGEAAAAPGLTAAEWASYDGRSAAGLAAGWCLRAAADWWFAGVDTSVGTSTSLVLLNASPSTAVVDVAVFGRSGPVDVPGGRGIAVSARSERVIDLAGFAPGRASLGVHVRATTGRIVAAVRTSRLRALTPTGVDWVPEAHRPATSLVVGAAAGGSTSHHLVVVNPGDRQAVVRVSFVSRSGTFTSTHVADLSISPGAVVTADVSPVVGSAAMGIRLSSTRPVVAAAVDESTRPVRDFSVSPAGQPLHATAVVPVIPGTTLRLAFSSADRAPAVVRLTSVDGRGRAVGQARVAVRSQGTATWTAAGGPARYLLVTVPPGSHLYASAGFTADSGTATLPVLSGLWTEVHAGVVPAPAG